MCLVAQLEYELLFEVVPFNSCNDLTNSFYAGPFAWFFILCLYLFISDLHTERRNQKLVALLYGQTLPHSCPMRQTVAAILLQVWICLLPALISSNFFFPGFRVSAEWAAEFNGLVFLSLLFWATWFWYKTNLFHFLGNFSSKKFLLVWI